MSYGDRPTLVGSGRDEEVRIEREVGLAALQKVV